MSETLEQRYVKTGEDRLRLDVETLKATLEILRADNERLTAELEHANVVIDSKSESKAAYRDLMLEASREVDRLTAELAEARAEVDSLRREAAFLADVRDDLVRAAEARADEWKARAETLAGLLREAFVAGFRESGEGYNGEYPLGHPGADERAVRCMAEVYRAYSDWLESAATPEPPVSANDGDVAGDGREDAPETER